MKLFVEQQRSALRAGCASSPPERPEAVASPLQGGRGSRQCRRPLAELQQHAATESGRVAVKPGLAPPDDPGRGPSAAGAPPPEGCDENLDLITTLQAGLKSAAASTRQAPQAVPEVRSVPTFWRPDGRAVDLPVGDQDSLTYRIEALRVFLEGELGLDAFLRLHRYLNATVQQDEERDEGGGKSLASMVPPEALEFLPLVHQLIVCEDECYSHR